MPAEKTPAPSVDESVRARYAAGAAAREAALCCPVDYDRSLLEVIPQEVVERDYGCGDPTKHLRRGETVLDLGSGTGKACFMAAQVVGPEGRVIGVDMTDEMLEVARRNAPIVGERLGFSNVEFRKGKIQDLQLDREALDAWLRANPVQDEAALARLEAEMARLRAEEPLVPSDSIDVVVSNCVLNLVDPDAKRVMFEELFRVLAPGGRAVISDIVCDEDVPEHLQRDPELWSGCISGAFREDELLEAFEDAGFHGVTVLERQAEPWQVVEGIEFRSLTVAAWKGIHDDCRDQGHAVVYRGPFKAVIDDGGHALPRGARAAVCGQRFALYASEPYRAHFDLLAPAEPIPAADAPPFPCDEGTLLRDPAESKGAGERTTDEGAGSCCAPSKDDGASSCC